MLSAGALAGIAPAPASWAAGRPREELTMGPKKRRRACAPEAERPRTTRLPEGGRRRGRDRCDHAIRASRRAAGCRGSADPPGTAGGAPRSARQRGAAGTPVPGLPGRNRRAHGGALARARRHPVRTHAHRGRALAGPRSHGRDRHHIPSGPPPRLAHSRPPHIVGRPDGDLSRTNEAVRPDPPLCGDDPRRPCQGRGAAGRTWTSATATTAGRSTVFRMG